MEDQEVLVSSQKMGEAILPCAHLLHLAVQEAGVNDRWTIQLYQFSMASAEPSLWLLPLLLFVPLPHLPSALHISRLLTTVHQDRDYLDLRGF